MVAVLKGLLVRMAATAGKAFLTERFALWCLKLAAKKTRNLVDDSAIEVVDHLLKGDAAKAEVATKTLLEKLTSKKV